MRSLTSYIYEHYSSKPVLESFQNEIKEVLAGEFKQLAERWKLQVEAGTQEPSEADWKKFIEFFAVCERKAWWPEWEHFVLCWDTTTLSWIVGQSFTVHGKKCLYIHYAGFAGIVDHLQELTWESVAGSGYDVICTTVESEVDVSHFSELKYGVFSKAMLNRVSNTLGCTLKELTSALKQVNNPQYIKIL